METKDAVRALLERLPDDCTIEDVLYHLYVLQEVEQGRADIATGHTIPHSEVTDELRRKWLLGAAK
jgi:predicted transcriptional regulator